MPEPLTEAQVIRALERLERAWPRDLLLFGGAGSLSLLRARTRQVIRHFRIPADGGDPDFEEETP